MKSWTEAVEATALEAAFAGGGEIGALMRSLDWKATPLGPIQHWPQNLRVAVNICLTCRFPTLLWWGAQRVVFYNDAAVQMLGFAKHPQCLAQPAGEGSGEVWERLGNAIADVFCNGVASETVGQLLLLDRHGYLEECYFNFSHSPIPNENGEVNGVLTVAAEMTGSVLAKRRASTLADIAAIANRAKNASDACFLALQILANNAADIPHALVYLGDEGGQTARLIGTTGLNSDMPAPPQLAELEDFSRLASHFSFLPSASLILPIAQVGREGVAGALVAGISARRTLDEDYRNFLELVARGIAVAIAHARARAGEQGHKGTRERGRHISPDPRVRASLCPSARLLLVDAHALRRDYVKRLLEQQYEVTAVGDEETARAVAREYAPDLIISDEELLPLLYADATTREIPTILLHAREEEDSCMEGLEVGADDSLIQSFCARELSSRVRSNIEIATLRAQLAKREQTLRGEAEATQKQIVNILESIADGFAFFDRFWRYTYVNSAAARLIGKQREELIGTNVWELFPEAISTSFYKKLCKALDEGISLTFEEFYPPLNKWFEIRAYPSSEGLPVYFRDITDRKQTEEKLHRRDREFQTLVENAPDIIARFDEEGRYLYVNRAIERATGMPPEAFIGKTLSEVGFPEEISQLWREKIQKVLGSRRECLFENVFATPKGTRYYQSRLVPELAPDGSVESAIAISYDIHKQKRVEAALRETNQTLKTLIKASPLAIIALDSQGIIKMWSPAAEKIFGWSEREALGRFIPFVPEDKKEEFIALHRRKLRGQLVTGTEVRRQKKDGSSIDIAIWGAPLPDAEGNISSTMAVIADISERLRSQEELRRERDFSAAVLNTIGSLVVVLNRLGRIVSFNRACEKTTGYTFDEVKDTYLWDRFLIPDEVEAVKGVFENLLTGGCSSSVSRSFPNQYENYWLTKDGDRRLIAWSNTVLLDEVGEVQYVIGTGIDITERRRAEEALEKSEARFRRLAESNLIGIFFADFSGNISDANDAFLQMVGYSREDLRAGLRWDAMTPDEFRELDEIKIREMQASGFCTPWEKEYIRKDGTRVPVWLGVNLLADSRENCICFIIDLTERKQMEEALRFTLQKLNFHVENTPLAVIEWDGACRVSRWSPSAQKLFGWQAEEVLGKEASSLPIAFQKNVEGVSNFIGSLLNGARQQKVLVYRNYTKNGAVIDCEWYNSALLDDRGNLVSVLSLVLDVTERQAALEALQQSKERFRIAAESASDLIYEWDMRSDRLEWFGNIDERLGYASGEFPRTLQAFHNLIDEGDRERFGAAVERHLKTREPFFQEYRLRRRNGSLLYWTERGTALWDENGEPYKWIGVASDVTAQQLARDEILKLNQALLRRVEELQTLLQVIPVGIGIAEDAECKYIRVNRTLAKLLGISADANDEARVLPSRLPPTYKICCNGKPLSLEELPMRYAARHGIEVINVETEIIREDGKVVKVLTSAAPLFDEEGNTRGCVGATLDITERKRTEEALRLSEERYRTLAEALPDMVCLSSGKGIIDYCNQSWLDYTGLTLKQTQVSGRLEALHPEDRVGVVGAWERARSTGDSFSLECRLRRADGGYRWHALRGRPIKGEDGDVASWLAIASDIDDQKRAREQERFLADASNMLAHSLEYQTTLERVARLAVTKIADWCAIDLVEPDGSVQMLAIAHADTAKAEIARELQKRYPPKMNVSWGMPKVLRSGNPEVYSQIPDSWLLEASHNSEHLQYLRDLGLGSAIFVPLKARGRTLGAISFVLHGCDRRYQASDLALASSLAERAAIAIDNARLYREAQEANRLKDEFLAALSHELRTPINAILGWAQILRSRKLDREKTFKALETIERNARAQTQLIEDLLDVSRIITGKLRLETEAVELVGAIEAALDSVRPAAEAKCIQLTSVLDSQAAIAMGDRDRLQQVVWNLLCNAIKFTPEGGRVEVSLKKVEGRRQLCEGSEQNVSTSNAPSPMPYAQIQVSDTGIGIDSDFLPHVFERFRQADGSLNKDYNGLGLGLAIVRHLVELHGGSVWVESPGIGKGATFTVRLPLRAASLKTADEPQKNVAIAKSSFIERPSLEGLRVLVVDDREDSRAFVGVILEECGALVTTAASAALAIAALKNSNFDVLISDIAMPYEDGYSLIRKIRTMEAERGGFLPAAALTAYAREEDRTRALLAGFQLHLPKPVDAAELVAVVANLANRAGLLGKDAIGT